MIFTAPLTGQQHRYPALLLFLLLLQILITPPAESAAKGSNYSVVLASAPGKDLKWELRKSDLFKGRTAYIQRTAVKGKPWERLCVGYFDSHKHAISIQKQVQSIYPGAWVQKTSKKNIVSIISGPGATPTATAPEIASANRRTTSTGSSTLTDEQLDSLMQRSKSDFKNKKYSSSIRYLNALIAAGDHKYAQEALELLGQARQRNGQKAHAVDTYEKYLKLYPDSDDSDRVQQRLAGLLTETSAPEKELRMKTIDLKDKVTTHGSFSQFYQNYSTSIDDIGNITELSQLVSLLDLNTLYSTTRFDHGFQFTADHVYDFNDSDDDNEFRFIEAYYDLGYRKTGTSARIGRQRLQIGGVLQRFDGATIGYQFNPDLRLNILGGLPVDFDNKTSFNKHKTFYGFILETGTFFNHWTMNLFYFDQDNDGVQDRNSIGTEVRYRDKRKSLFGLIDYDLLYDEINILQLNGNIFFDQGRTVYMNVLSRKSPLLTTSNALIGRQEQTIEELKEVLNIEQIYQLARDRTANSETVSVGGSLPVNNTFRLTGDITFTHVGDTVASGGVAATPDTGTDFFFSTQLVGNSLLMKNDTNVFGIRFNDTEPSSITSFIVNSRFPVTRSWRINPRLQYDIRSLTDGQSRNKLRAIFRTDYRYLNNIRFDFEVGYDKNSGETVGQLLGDSSLFFTLGYRWDF